MTLYVLRRLASIVVVLVLISIIIFVAIHVLPGSAATLILGEYGEHYNNSCNSTNTQAIVGWADTLAVSYEAWAWDTWGQSSDLISNFNGTPAASAYASWVHAHYLALP